MNLDDEESYAQSKACKEEVKTAEDFVYRRLCLRYCFTHCFGITAYSKLEMESIIQNGSKDTVKPLSNQPQRS